MAKLLPVLLLAVFLTFVITRFTSKPLNFTGTEEPVQKQESKKYWMVTLRSGSNNQQEPATSSQFQDAMARNLAKEGKLLLVSDLKDVFIIECKDSLEVAELINQDSAITAGWLKAEISPCWTAKGMLAK